MTTWPPRGGAEEREKGGRYFGYSAKELPSRVSTPLHGYNRSCRSYRKAGEKRGCVCATVRVVM